MERLALVIRPDLTPEVAAEDLELQLTQLRERGLARIEYLRAKEAEAAQREGERRAAEESSRKREALLEQAVVEMSNIARGIQAERERPIVVNATVNAPPAQVTVNVPPAQVTVNTPPAQVVFNTPPRPKQTLRFTYGEDKKPDGAVLE